MAGPHSQPSAGLRNISRPSLSRCLDVDCKGVKGQGPASLLSACLRAFGVGSWAPGDTGDKTDVRKTDASSVGLAELGL